MNAIGKVRYCTEIFRNTTQLLGHGTSLCVSSMKGHNPGKHKSIAEVQALCLQLKFFAIDLLRPRQLNAIMSLKFQYCLT